jgi:hypothetical protein
MRIFNIFENFSLGGSIGGTIGKEAAERAAKELAEKAAIETAKKIAGKAAKEAAEKAANKIAQKTNTKAVQDVINFDDIYKKDLQNNINQVKKNLENIKLQKNQALNELIDANQVLLQNPV